MHTCIHMDACLDVCVCRPMHAFACAHPSTCTHCVHTCVYTHAHACMYTHTQACTQDTNPKLCDSRIEKGENKRNHDAMMYTYIPTHLQHTKQHRPMYEPTHSHTHFTTPHTCVYTHRHTCFQEINPKLSERKT
jgi:hypothetical protein